MKIIITGTKKGEMQSLRDSLNIPKAKIETMTLESLTSKWPKDGADCLLLIGENLDKTMEGWVERIKQFDDHVPIIVLSQSKEVENIVRLMKKGVYDYCMMPVDLPRLELCIGHAINTYQLTKRVFLLENQLGGETRLDEIVGGSPSMQTIFQTIRNVAKTNATVLITGESGTGKELVAKAMHHLSPRSNRRFIDINCGAIPKELLENELFGHERGAYTGADRRYIGCCERADGGTLFLDEISEMDPALQVKLLRFLQERTFSRVGGNEAIKVDVRIVAATNQNLSELVSQGKFREDLYYRLNVVLIVIPPLRERKEDIPLLAKHFLEKYNHKNEKIFLDFNQEAMEALVQFPWPGNVRELENAIERTVVLHNDTTVKLKHFPPLIQKQTGGHSHTLLQNTLSKEQVLPLLLVERYAIEAALKACTGNVRQAAKRLRIGQATLYRKIKQYGIQT